MNHPQAASRPGRQHVVQFYESESDLCDAVCRFLSPGFRDGRPLIVIARPNHCSSFSNCLRQQDCDVDGAIRSGQLLQLDASQTLATFMKGSLPDRDLFFESISRVLEKSRIGREQSEILAYGEMVDILWRDGNHSGALRLEELWNELAETHPFRLLCAYAADGFSAEAHPKFESICRTHTQVLPVEDYTTPQHLHSFFQAIVESAEDAIISKTLDGIISSWNPGAERLFGYSASEVIGRPITILIPSDHPDEEPRILERLRRGERIEHYETRRVRKDGTLIDISLTVSPIIDDDGHIIGASKIARDITQRKRLEEEHKNLLLREQAARKDAETANRVKDEFLAILSHELRTPLNAIVGWAGILESGQAMEHVGRAAEVIKRNAFLQERLIEDLLDMAGIVTGKITVRTERVDLCALVTAAVESLRLGAARKGIGIEFEAGDSEYIVTGDADRLHQVVWNLLSNSIKFTPAKGTIQLRLQSAGSNIELEIADNGQGIDPQFLPFVFERFRQGEQTTTRRHSGLGLGLALVRHIVELHGGSVVAASPGLGHGSTFTVRLPAACGKD